MKRSIKGMRNDILHCNTKRVWSYTSIFFVRRTIEASNQLSRNAGSTIL